MAPSGRATFAHRPRRGHSGLYSSRFREDDIEHHVVARVRVGPGGQKGEFLHGLVRRRCSLRERRHAGGGCAEPPAGQGNFGWPQCRLFYFNYGGREATIIGMIERLEEEVQWPLISLTLKPGALRLACDRRSPKMPAQISFRPDERQSEASDSNHQQ